MATSRIHDNMMDMNMEDCVSALKALGMDYTQDTSSNLPVEMLRKKVSKALEYTQSSMKEKTINLTTLKSWAIGTENKPVAEATNTPISYLQIAHQAFSSSIKRADARFEDPFLDLRQTVMALGIYWDNGERVFMVEESSGKYGFTLRVRFSRINDYSWITYTSTDCGSI